MDDRERVRSLISVSQKEGPHGVRFRIDGQRFGVCKHHKGNKQIKSCYVVDFLRAMIDLGWYDEADDANERP
jgi:hypothetical protein